MSAFDDLTVNERLVAANTDLEARLQLADERVFFLIAELASANAKLGITDYRTKP